MTPLFRKFLGSNWVLFATAIGLLIFGVFSVYSATHFHGDADMVTKWNDQVRWILIGLGLYFAISLVDYRWLRWGCIPAYLFGLVLLVAVQVAPDSIAPPVHGAKSWIKIGSIQFQPSQPAIMAGIAMLGVILADGHKYVPVLRNNFLRMALAAAVAGLPCLLVLKEGDFGSASVWIPVLCAMLLVGSIPFRYLIVIGIAGLIVLPLGYNFGLKDYQKERIEVFLKVWKGEKIDTQRSGYAIDKILKAVGSAGWEGKGYLGKHVPDQKTMNRMGFIPKDTAMNDFIFAVVAEEQGFRGGLLLLSSFAFLILQLVFIAFCSRDQLGRLIVVGYAGLLFAHVFQHVGMNIGLLPITGIPLPFISYGGTFTVTILMLLGFAQSVWVHRNTPVPDKPKAASL